MINAAIFWGRASFIKLGANKFIHKSFTQSVYTRHWFHCTCENPVSFGKTIVSNKNSWACLNARIRRPSIYTLQIISLYSVIPAVSSVINGSYVSFSHTLVFIKNIVWLHVHMNRLKDFFCCCYLLYFKRVRPHFQNVLLTLNKKCLLTLYL